MARSNRLLIVGGAVTLLGAALVLAVLFLQRPPATTPSSSSEATGTPADAVEAPRVVTAQEGESVVRLDIPEGTSAVAFTVDFQRSVAGIPVPGDRVDVFGRGEGSDGSALAPVLDDVEVLTVTGAAHESNGGAPTVVLAVPEDEIGAALATHLTDPVYLTLRRDDGEQGAES